MTMQAYFDQTMQALSVDDVMHGVSKSAIFGILITVVGVVDGSSVKGGAEGVGRATMMAVVGSCLSVLVADYFLAIILFQIIFKK